MTQPNILFILIDDLGYADLRCFGSRFYETPNLDRLAADGLMFTDAYASCPVCSPTRASLLTGKYPANVGVTNYIDWGGKTHPSKGRLIDAPYIDHIPRQEHGLAAALRDGGYQTWHVGKWHCGGPGSYPEDHGFEVNIGGAENGLPTSGYFSPWNLRNLEDREEGEYLTDRLTDEAIRLLEHRDPEKPFFLNLWHYAVHTPIQAPAELVEKYERKRKDLGIDEMTELVEGDPFPTEHKKDKGIQRRIVQGHAAYAAMVENLDTNIGRLLDALEAQGLADETIVIFTSDNGGLSTAEGSPTCNAPLAEGKGWMYEGGTREPTIVRWPARITPGTVCREPITSPDLYPTLLELAGLPALPEQHVDGVSFARLLNQPDASLDREAIFWHYPHYGNQGGTPGSSVRRGDLKLIEFFEDGRLELYNLREDLSEDRNLAADQPDVAREMRGLLADWRNRVEAKIPQPNPDWTPPPGCEATV